MPATPPAPAGPTTATATTTGLLRLATAGSVDDGKSTLVGRLLHDSKLILGDQLAAVQRASSDRGLAEVDLALLTDGLRAEREQGITIDVAYRYFATPRRRFILADTPGHVQYTRNMVTGASTADLAVILVDARHGIVDQTRRHAAIATLLRVPHLVLAVNKMDLVGYDEAVFARIAAEFAGFAARLGSPEVTAIPISALKGDNVVDPGARTDWYAGPTFLDHLESVPAGQDPAAEAARFPVQYVIRAGRDDYRGYAGQLVSGVLRVGQPVTVLPGGRQSTIIGIDLDGGCADEAVAQQSVALRLADDLDVSRGDLITPVADAPSPVQDLDATVCHLSDRPLRPGQRVLLRHTTRTVRAVVQQITYRLDITTLGTEPDPEQLYANDIATVHIRTAAPINADPYAVNRYTGAFLLIDETTGDTLTAGMVAPVTLAF